MKPQTISKRKSGPKGSPLFNMLCETMNAHPYEEIQGHDYFPVDVNIDDYIWFGQSPDRDYYKLKTV